MGTEKKQQNSSAAFKVGAVSLAFLIMGYQAALFVHRAAQLRIEANRDCPDTVYIYVKDSQTADRIEDIGKKAEKAAASVSVLTLPTASAPEAATEERRYATHSQLVENVRKATRNVESFKFNPNSTGLEDFMRLGFSEKQAQSILNYRAKGGRFRRKEDFAKSFVVADSVYARLEPFIDIPLLDINTADSADFDALPGIGPWFASQMVQYREKIGSYTSVEQLMDIKRFDSERFEALKDLVTCGRQNADDGSE